MTLKELLEKAVITKKPARDENFRLLCGAAVSVPRTPDGEIDSQSLHEHVQEMVEQGLDMIAVSTAHGHTKDVGAVTASLRREFPDLAIMAGNVTSAEGVEFLSEAGADSIKVGQGPGSICTTSRSWSRNAPDELCMPLANRGRCPEHPGSRRRDHQVRRYRQGINLGRRVICGLLAGCREAWPDH